MRLIEPFLLSRPRRFSSLSLVVHSPVSLFIFLLLVLKFSIIFCIFYFKSSAVCSFDLLFSFIYISRAWRGSISFVQVIFEFAYFNVILINLIFKCSCILLK